MPTKTLHAFLAEQNNAVILLEAQAETARTQNDAATYNQLMRTKAQLLAKLCDAATPHLAHISPTQADMIADRLQRFSAAARNALQLESVFYMSALLYPDDHKPGEPSDLDIFIQSLP